MTPQEQKIYQNLAAEMIEINQRMHQGPDNPKLQADKEYSYIKVDDIERLDYIHNQLFLIDPDRWAPIYYSWQDIRKNFSEDSIVTVDNT